MNTLIDNLIHSLTKQEYREFKYFLLRGANTTENRKDLAVLESIRKKTPLPEKNGHSFYQAKKRLKKLLEQFAILESLHHDTSSEIHTYMDIAKYLFHKNLYAEAWSYLAKAETLAEKEGQFILLDQILGIQIAYSYNVSIPAAQGKTVPELIDKMVKNKALDMRESFANAAYCELIYEIKKTLSKNAPINIEELKQNIFKKYNLGENVDINNLTSYSKYISIILVLFREEKNYTELRTRSIKFYNTLLENKLLDKLSNDFVFNLLDHICASTIRIKDYVNHERFIPLYFAYAKKMQAGSKEKTYYDFTPYVDLADLYLVTNRFEQAKESLLTAKKLYGNVTKSTRIFYLLRINLMGVHFMAMEYDECIKLYQEFILFDEKKFLNELYFGVEHLLLTDIYGILFYYEAKENYYAQHLLTQLKRKYASVLKSGTASRENYFVKILQKTMTTPGYLKSKKFLSDAEQFIALKQFMPGDWEYISLNVWLISKINRKNFYDCFLEEVKP